MPAFERLRQQLERMAREFALANAPDVLLLARLARLAGGAERAQADVMAFVVDHLRAVRSTLFRLESDRCGPALRRPEILLALERLEHDPEGLRQIWPAARGHELRALASAYGRPYGERLDMRE